MIVKGGEIITMPDSNEILPGITKLLVLRICRKYHIPFEERKFTIQEMMDADEVIVTDTKTECCPVIQIEDKVIGDGKRGPVTALLDEKYKEMIVEQCKEVM